MVQISLELIRRKAEHNDGDLSTLEELSLHQLEITKIQHLDRFCRELRILYLQGNLIDKIENLSRLKKLTYLNLALNNIQRIENLRGCESLQKLDLTLNFIGKISDIGETLGRNIHLSELYLTGNPCAGYECSRQFVIAKLPSLKMLDGVEISRTERIAATRDLAHTESLTIQQEFKYQAESDNTQQRMQQRTKTHEDIQNKRAEKQKQNGNSEPEHNETRARGAGERILNVNQPKVPFTLAEEDQHLILKIDIYKYVDTTLIDVDVHPTFVQVTIKGKLLRLVLPEEVLSSNSRVERSRATGRLTITMPKLKPMAIITKRSADKDALPDLEAL